MKERKKKILFVGNTAWSMYNFRLEVMKALRDDGHEIFVLAPGDDWSEKLIKEGIPYVPIKIDNKGTSPIKDAKLVWRLYKQYKRIKPDVIFHYTIKPNIYGSLAAAFLKIVSVSFVTGSGSVFIKETFLTFIVKALFKFSFRFPRLVWFLNSDDLNLFISSRLLDPGKCGLLPGEGIDTLKFHTEGIEKAHDNFIFLFLGRVLIDKGIREFVSAAQEIKSKYEHVQFNILGFTDSQNPSSIPQWQMDEWIKNGTIEYLGVSDDVTDTIKDSDCVVLPSYREGIPKSLLEAASLCKPVIASNVPGCKDVVDNNITGYLCKPRDQNDLLDKMEMMINDGSDMRKAMGQAGRKKVIEQFDVQIVINEYKKMINDGFSL